MSTSTRETARNLWQILFQVKGSIWTAVLPYCILNCILMLIVELLAHYEVRIAFSPSGHGLMTLIVSFLVIQKVNLSYDRYMNARQAMGHALSALREMNQAALTFTQHLPTSNKLASQWRRQIATRTIDLIDCTIRVLKNGHQACYLAKNVDMEWKTEDEPMLHAQALRNHLYTVNVTIFNESRSQSGTSRQLELFERMKMVDLLNEYIHNYRNLLVCASTPLPFPLVQMARTFLFLYTFSIPLVLRGVVSELFSALGFVFFLTYGFVGLELVALKLMSPFGDGTNDLNITGMREATIIGIEKDMQIFGEVAKLRDPRLEYSRQKPQPPMKTDVYDTPAIDSQDSAAHQHHSGNPMHTSHENLYHPAP